MSNVQPEGDTIMLSRCVPVRSSVLALAAAIAAPAFAQAQPQPQPQAQPQRARPAAQPPVGQPARPPAKPRTGQADEVVVTGTRADVVATPDRVSFRVTDDLQVQTGTLADALRAVPGVEVDLQGRVSLRGDADVTILIDGRPSAMLRGESRGDVLLSMPANRVERVELITNPSAALSPEGSAGVINLVTRRVSKDTRTAAVRATVGGRDRYALNLGGALSKGRLSATGDIGYRRFTTDADVVELRSRVDPTTGSVVDSRLDSAIRNSLTAQTARVGVDYDLDKKNRISGELSYREASGDVARAERFRSADAATSYDRASSTDLSQRALDARASWRRTLPGKDHELLAEVEVENGRLRREVEGVTAFTAGGGFSERIRNAGERTDYTAKVDYKRPVGKEGALELGYQANVSNSRFDYAGARGAAFDSLVPVPGLTNQFDYDLSVHALFGTYKFGLGKLDVETGLRLEQALTRIVQIADATRFDNDYFRAYPTLHLGYALSKTDQLRGSYSRRIQRPSAQDLNPYLFYVDPQNVRRGNPNLLPEVTNSFELGWQHRKAGNFVSLTGFYRHASGGVTDILSDLGNGVFLTSRANLATAERAGAELIANGRLSKKLSYNGSATILWTSIDSRAGGVTARRSGTTAIVRANLSWQPKPKDYFQLNAVYTGKQLLPQGYRSSSGILNLGYRRKFNERLSGLVTAQNVLDTARQVTLFESPTLRDQIRQHGAGRILLVGLAWNIGGASKKRPEPGFDFQQGGDVPQ
jgi:outer membrane receptor protein involved in Fe transport